MAVYRKQSWLSWDVTIGLLLVVCGLVLAFWDRSKQGVPPAGGNAAVIGGPRKVDGAFQRR